MADTDTINPALMPQEGISYPIKVDYCPNCTMPFEVKKPKPKNQDKIKQHKNPRSRKPSRKVFENDKKFRQNERTSALNS